MHKILIVDDDEATLKLMRRRLSEAYEAICTRDPEQALGLALEHKPDAILLDLMMPKFSGGIRRPGSNGGDCRGDATC